MVFSGKPSTGCQMCRTRRIKCDEAKPACSQCVRTSRTCPGYKSQIDLLFRNETGASAAEKHTRAAARKKAGASATAGPATQANDTALPSSASQSQTPSVSPVAAPAAQAVSLSSSSVSNSLPPSESSKPIASYRKNRQPRNLRNPKNPRKLATAAGRRNAAASNNRVAGRISSSGLIDQEAECSESTPPISRTVQRRQRSGNVEVIIPALAPPPDDLAINHFFANFVMVPYENSNRGYLDFLLPLMHQVNSPVASRLAGVNTWDKKNSVGDICKPPSEGSAALSYAFRACALASIGTRVASDRYPFMEKAVAAYTRALAATHSALRDADLSRADCTLAAVLLLGIFESITAKKLGLFAWGSHIEGAIEIAKRRSNAQRCTRIGRGLFVAVRTQMIIHSLATGKPPGMGCDWWFEDAVNNSVAAHCQRLGVGAAELRAEVAACMGRVSLFMAQKPPAVMAQVGALAERAYALDRECVAWMENPSAEWTYHPVAWQDKLPEGSDYSTAEIFPGYVDMYPDLYISGCWNMIRATRLCLASIIVRCAAWVCWPADYRTTPEHVVADVISKEMIDGIIASVPFYLGFQSRYSALGRDGRGGQGGRGSPDKGWIWLGDHESASPVAFPPTPPRESAAPAPAPAPTTTSYPHSASSTSTRPYPSTVPRQTTSPPAAAAESSESTSSSSTQPHQYQFKYYKGPGHKKKVPVSPPKTGYMLGDETELKGLAGYFLAWPLLNVASQDQTTDEQREWVIGRLKYISEAVGVRYAEFLSGIKFRAPSMMIGQDRAIAQQVLQAATGQIGKGDPVVSPFIVQLGIKKSSIRGDSFI